MSGFLYRSLKYNHPEMWNVTMELSALNEQSNLGNFWMHQTSSQNYSLQINNEQDKRLL